MPTTPFKKPAMMNTSLAMDYVFGDERSASLASISMTAIVSTMEERVLCRVLYVVMNHCAGSIQLLVSRRGK